MYREMLLARVVAQNKASTPPNNGEASQGGHRLAGTGFPAIPGGKDDQLQFYNMNSADREHQIIDDTTASGVFNDQLPRPHR